MVGLCLACVTFLLYQGWTTGDLYGNLVYSNNYRKQLFPTWDRPSENFKLNIHTYPGALVDFAETEEKISLMCTLLLNWTDPRLTWDPSVNSNIYYLSVTPEDIWLPYIYLANDMNGVKPIGYDSAFYAHLNMNGVVYWSPGTLLEAQCTPKVLRFPFETHTCRFFFNMWGVNNDAVQFIAQTETPALDHYYENSDWDLLSFRQSIHKDKTIQNFILEMTIKRRPMYYVVTVILPTLLFALMNPLVFCLPVESGERISLGMTILLAYAIFLTIVSSSIPELSNPVCAIIIVLVMIMLVSGVIVIMATVSSHYYYKNIDETGDINSCLKCLATAVGKRKGAKKEEIEDATTVTRQKVSRALDFSFCFVSYVLFACILGGYAIFILCY